MKEAGGGADLLFTSSVTPELALLTLESLEVEVLLAEVAPGRLECLGEPEAGAVEGRRHW